MDDTAKKKIRFWKIILWFSVAGTVVPPMAGLAGTITAMIQAFDAVGLSGGSDSEALAQDISLSLMSIMGGLFISVLSIPVLVTSLVMIKRIKKSYLSAQPGPSGEA